MIAIVLAGGRSSRFGSDKMTVELDGVPLLHHAIRAVARVAGEVLVVTSPEAAPDLPVAPLVRVVRDPEAYGGPLVGLLAALDGVSSDDGAVAIVVGGDMPRLDADLLGSMARALRDDDTIDAVTLEHEGRPRPLPIAVRIGPARAAGHLARAAGERALRSMLARLRTRVIPEAEWRLLDPDGGTMRDIDHRADLTDRT